MKKFLSVMVLAVAIFSFSSQAEAMSDAVVVNCNEWISLREYPSTSAPRIIKVPLGAHVSVNLNYEDDQGPTNGFYYTNYGGHWSWCLQYYIRIL